MILLHVVTFCLLGNFTCFFDVCRFFSESAFSKNSWLKIKAGHFIGPNLSPNCLQMLSADETMTLVGKELTLLLLEILMQLKCHLFQSFAASSC